MLQTLVTPSTLESKSYTVSVVVEYVRGERRKKKAAHLTADTPCPYRDSNPRRDHRGQQSRRRHQHPQHANASQSREDSPGRRETPVHVGLKGSSEGSYVPKLAQVYCRRVLVSDRFIYLFIRFFFSGGTKCQKNEGRTKKRTCTDTNRSKPQTENERTHGRKRDGPCEYHGEHLF